MRNAGAEILAFVNRAGLDVNAHCDNRRGVVFLHQNREAVREYSLGDARRGGVRHRNAQRYGQPRHQEKNARAT